MKIYNFLMALSSCLVLLCACNFESEMHFLKKPVAIDILLRENTLGATKVYIEAFPAHDEVYYVWDVVPCERLDNFKRSEKQYMELVLDGLYAQYINWRHQKLEAGEHYIGTFANQYLSYGKTHYFYTELTPDTDYYVFAFCVNSETNRPMGELTKKKFHTKAPASPNYRNEMTIDFEVNGSKLLVIPSVEDVDDYYIWSYISEYMLEEKYHGNLEEWALDTYATRLANHTLRNSICLGIVKDQLLMAAGETYVVAAAPYDANFEKTIFSRRFTYDGSQNFTVPRGHD